MALLPTRCVLLTCDVCGDGWADLDAEPHFPDRASATRYAVHAGWIVTPRRAVCSDCTGVEVCGLAGHRWGGWTPAGPFPSAGGGTWEGRVRYCRGCSSGQWDPPSRRRGRRAC